MNSYLKDFKDFCTVQLIQRIVSFKPFPSQDIKIKMDYLEFNFIIIIERKAATKCNYSNFNDSLSPPPPFWMFGLISHAPLVYHLSDSLSGQWRLLGSVHLFSKPYATCCIGLTWPDLLFEHPKWFAFTWLKVLTILWWIGKLDSCLSQKHQCEVKALSTRNWTWVHQV